jgi:predicted nucleotidyltransferase
VSAVPRDVVEMDRWVEVAKRRRREIAAAVAAFIKKACRVGDVALFGLRARGGFHDMSDWYLAVVTQDGEYAVKTEELGQVVYIPLAKLRQLLAFSMLILDVAYEGRLLCGRGELWQGFAREVAQYVCLLLARLSGTHDAVSTLGRTHLISRLPSSAAPLRSKYTGPPLGAR